MSLRPVHALAFAWSSSLALGACKPSPPTGKLQYYVQSSKKELAGATLIIGGKRTKFGSFYDNRTSAAVEFPRTGTALLSTIQLELATPCGTKVLPVATKQAAAAEETARKDPSDRFTIDLVNEPAIAERLVVWVDAPNATVELGDAKLAHGDNTLFDPGCKASYDVKVAGAPVGSFTHDKTKAGLFVTGDKAACYAHTLVSYRAGGPGDIRQVLRGAQIHPLSNAEVEYFLTPAPSSVKASSGAAVRDVYELVKTACP